MRCHWCILLIASFVTTAIPQEKDSPAAPMLLPGNGVGEPDGTVGYFPNTTGGIDARSLATGQLLWSSKDASKPLLARNDRLYAMANSPDKGHQVLIKVFDAKTGKPLLTSNSIQFPEWVSPVWNENGPGGGRSFQATAYLAGDQLLFVWDAHTWYAGGARPSPEIEQAARKNANGVEAVNLQSGKLDKLYNAKLQAAVEGKIPNGPANLTLAGLTLSLTDEPIKGKGLQQRRFLQATDAAGRMQWRYEILAPIVLPPRP